MAAAVLIYLILAVVMYFWGALQWPIMFRMIGFAAMIVAFLFTVTAALLQFM